MSSKVTISNMAIAALGQKSFIQSMTEASVEARYANLFYDQCRKATLRAHPWNCATSRKQLASLGAGIGKWRYTYAVPSNCLKARYIVPFIPSEKVPFEVALSDDGNSRVLYTDRENATLVYTVDLDNPDLFDAMFIDALSLSLAFRLSPTIAPNRAQEMSNRFVNAMRSAQTVDASEGEIEDVSRTSWLEDRVSSFTHHFREVDQ